MVHILNLLGELSSQLIKLKKNMCSGTSLIHHLSILKKKSAFIIKKALKLAVKHIYSYTHQ